MTPDPTATPRPATPHPAALPPTSPPAALTSEFPGHGPLLRLAFRELNLAANGTPEQVAALGDLSVLPRPWDPATCRSPALRQELWAWLDAVVTWLISQYSWDVAGVIPACWPRHPHLVHELAVVADQRRRAGTSPLSDALEEWHRYCLPAFAERLRVRVKNHCDDGHQPWPAAGRLVNHVSPAGRRDRENAYTGDVASLTGLGRRGSAGVPGRCALVDLETGEVDDDPGPHRP